MSNNFNQTKTQMTLRSAKKDSSNSKESREISLNEFEDCVSLENSRINVPNSSSKLPKKNSSKNKSDLYFTPLNKKRLSSSADKSLSLSINNVNINNNNLNCIFSSEKSNNLISILENKSLRDELITSRFILPKEEEEQNKRDKEILDFLKSLSYILEGHSVCAASGLYKNKIYLAHNAFGKKKYFQQKIK